MSELFENHPIHIQDLPQIEDEHFTPLEPSYKVLMHFRNVLFYVSVLTILIALFVFKREDFEYTFLLSLIPVVVLWAFAILMVQLGFPRKAYQLRDHDILYKTGYFIRKNTAIPKNRIQHVEIRQGVLARMFKLSKLMIFTAGGNSSDLSIPGLKPDVAQQLKEHISKNISAHE
jgi:membrane protein YdbS with pleckstrin-like domain